MDEKKKQCFVIAPIGEPDSDTRKRSDQVLRHIIRPAVEQCGYYAVRADEIDKPGVITSQVIQHVVNDPLVIADLTETNPNVFYELAIRHAIKKPLVQIIKKGERIPFDVAGLRTVIFDHRDLDSVESAKNEIIEQIKSLEKNDEEIETPISISLDLQILRQSDKPEERSLADIVAAISNLSINLAKLEEKVTSQNIEVIRDEIRTNIKELFYRIQDIDNISSKKRLYRKFDPYMLRKMARILPESGSPVGILVLLGLFRDEAPWLYEIGIEAYRRAREGDVEGVRYAIKDMRKLSELVMDSPMGMEMMGNKDIYILFKELPMLLEEFLHSIPMTMRRRKNKDNIE
ncbi:hypothetical protein JCM12298_26500 [Desulfothermus naphthae]